MLMMTNANLRHKLSLPGWFQYRVAVLYLYITSIHVCQVTFLSTACYYKAVIRLRQQTYQSIDLSVRKCKKTPQSYIPSILLRSALWTSGNSSASRLRSALAQTMKAFIGRRILASPPARLAAVAGARAVTCTGTGVTGPPRTNCSGISAGINPDSHDHTLCRPGCC